MSNEQAPTIQSSIADVWHLKEIRFSGRTFRIITQNFNGPCSFIAICNILILRGNIEVLPPTRRNVSYEFLSHLVADYLLNTSSNVDVSAALSVMPYTQKGMDLNPVFTSSTSFRPSGSIGNGGELKLFEHAGISLVHGWVVDPASPDAEVLKRVNDYDAAVELIAEVDHLTNGQFVVNEDEFAPLHGVSTAGEVPSRNYTEEELRKVQDAIVVRRFLDTTQSQLTYHGLFHLATTLPDNTLVALFRNSHLSVLYKHAPSTSSPTSSPSPGTPSSPKQAPPAAIPIQPIASGSSADPHAPLLPTPDPAQPDAETAIYSLVTDHVFLREPYVVWERFEDIDGGWSTFVDSDFVTSSPAGGDFAGQTAEETLRVAEQESMAKANVDPNDAALARQLQAEEDHHAQRQHEAYLRHQERKQAEEQRQGKKSAKEPKEEKQPKEKKLKKKGDCLIM
ncbi:hypothetical protein CPB83DRAFT_847257 [Crepidotus variabilis]|uniref:MINDY deubiquitinase domain-containing protein n=1 Tax=Crepidotus variabilis TaxID=179855 RepID=A0A9P6EPU5_9AGAR|nr:hypothetical protein CPB83DRAFT_847257 [Crepidotus variabilis]